MGNSGTKEKKKGGTPSTPKRKDNSSSSSSSSVSSTPASPPPPSVTTSSHPPPSSSYHHHHEDKAHHSASNTNSHHVDPPVQQSSKAEIADSKGFSVKKVEELFDKYKEKESDEEQIGPEGIEQLCKDINVDPEDVLVLVLAWYLNAQRMGFFSKEEFTTGLQKLGADNISKLKNQTSNFKRDLDDQAKFKDIHRFAFGFAKERDTKIIDLATADALLALVLGNRYPHTEPLRQYLKEQTTYKSVNLDQWMNILEFSRSIKADLSNYDENSAWPVLLDEYCEWAKKRLEKTPS